MADIPSDIPLEKKPDLYFANRYQLLTTSWLVVRPMSTYPLNAKNTLFSNVLQLSILSQRKQNPFFKIYFLIFNYDFVCISVCGMCICVWVCLEAKGIRSSWSWSYIWLSAAWCRCWESKSGPLKEQQTLLIAELSIQLPTNTWKKIPKWPLLVDCYALT